MNSSGTLAIGAIDSSVVKNISNIAWNEVVPFGPPASQNTTSSYLQWAIRLSSFAVRDVVLIKSLLLNRWPGQWYGHHANANISQRYWQLFVGFARCVRIICFSVMYWRLTLLSILRGTPGLYGPYQDVR
jgi:hypothetical protein